MEKKTEKFNTAWKAAMALSFVLYYSGIVFVYELFRKAVLRTPRKIILTYHRVNNDANDPEMTVTPANFKSQVEYLDQKFRIVPLDEILFAKPGGPVQDLVAITFDDGYADNFLYAFPILKERSAPAMIFLVADKVDRSEKMLTLDQIRLMQQNRISFGSHTCTHPVLAEVPLEVAEREIKLSREMLEAMLQQKVEFFAYPKGKAHQYGPAVKKLVEKHGYKAALTMENGTVTEATDLFEVKRLGVRDVPLVVFKTRISGILESFPFALARTLLRAH